MFIVSGTKRSGTSMWMQILVAAGLPVLGEAFPKNWQGGALKDANPEGFFEGPYRDGLFFATNPAPNGNFMKPEDTRQKIVKVFVPGVLRTEYSYIEGVIANVREWREYEASVDRLWELDDRQRLQEAPDAPPTLRLPAELEWWTENYALVRDRHIRGYPTLLQTYDQVLDDPEKYVARALQLVGSGDLRAAMTAVKPARRTKKDVPSNTLEPRLAQVFDDLYAAIRGEQPFTPAFVERLIAVNKELEPKMAAARMQRARQMIERGGPPPPVFMLAASMA
ncbi:MAG TPA: hypothetical protein VFG69_07895 [Nannocystaceae bacterium]|nr:hypothetical protein [Nannocystaceae bacterium]